MGFVRLDRRGDTPRTFLVEIFTGWIVVDIALTGMQRMSIVVDIGSSHATAARVNLSQDKYVGDDDRRERH